MVAGAQNIFSKLLLLSNLFCSLLFCLSVSMSILDGKPFKRKVEEKPNKMMPKATKEKMTKREKARRAKENPANSSSQKKVVDLVNSAKDITGC